MGEDTPMTAVKQAVGRVTSRVTTAFKAVTERNTRSGPTPDQMRQSVSVPNNDDPNEPQGIYKTVSPPPQGDTTSPDLSDTDSHTDWDYFDNRPRDSRDTVNLDTTDTTLDTDTDDTPAKNPEDCDHDWMEVPVNRFKLPGRTHRETCGECRHCGITDSELDSE